MRIIIRTKCPKCKEVFSVETNVSEPRGRPLAPLTQEELDKWVEITPPEKTELKSVKRKEYRETQLWEYYEEE